MQKKTRPHNYIFGPVRSRRLGLSLGIDPFPQKTCTFNCIYCQVGKTPHKTIERKEYAPKEEILKQLKKTIESSIRPNYITISGSGEPTLYSRLGELIDDIHKISTIPVCLITNSSLLWREDILNEAVRADLIIPSLDAPTEDIFRIINRPHPDVKFEDILKGLESLSNKAQDKVWLEVFIIKGVNNNPEIISKIAKILAPLRFAKVQLNTVSRPPAESGIKAASFEELKRLADLFTPPAEVIIDRKDHKGHTGYTVSTAKPTLIDYTSGDIIDRILDTIARRPCTIEDLELGLNLPKEEIEKAIRKLLEEGKIRKELIKKKNFYMCSHHRP